MTQPHVIFLDDERPQLDVYGRILRKENLALSLCTEVDEALAQLSQGEASAFFTDQYMPFQSGLEVLAQAREIAPEVPRGVISGKADLALATEAVNSGLADFFLTKPVRREELLGVLQKALQRKLRETVRDEELQEARALSLTDALTGLKNRRYFEGELARAVAGASRHDLPLSILFLDLNDFKAINDHLGHDMGDEVLCRAADQIRETCREVDLPARFAGDEFAILAPETDVAQAEIFAERLRGLRILPGCENPQGLCATISVGIATFPENGDTAEALLRYADQAMYENKRRIKSQLATVSASVPPCSRVVLLVDDEPDVRATLRRQLRHEADRILEADSVKEALAVLACEPVGCIISDLSMPGGSGIDLLELAAERYPQAQRVLLTAHGDYNASMDAINRARVHRLLNKPWDAQALRETIRGIFNSADSIEEPES